MYCRPVHRNDVATRIKYSQQQSADIAGVRECSSPSFALPLYGSLMCVLLSLHCRCEAVTFSPLCLCVVCLYDFRTRFIPTPTQNSPASRSKRTVFALYRVKNIVRYIGARPLAAKRAHTRTPHSST